ncbi:DEAD/DEAH box helicase [Clostridium paridis]|uniref:DEAD/DEAH box helicase n=1 Tax=Clostridium paridis TaxID=2803863 RepID=A0A937FG64_9CLOT|nr:DEAD/DEAH box helicase [Clostridium paridis]MBL4933204.1 DEAD/DEAH box helicase [Clostridium paridis]
MIDSTNLIEENEIDIQEIKHKEIKNERYLVDNKLIVNSDKGNLLDELKRCLSECEKFYFSVAFINFSGLQLLLDSFKDLEERGIKGKILTSTYLYFTDPNALERIKKFSNIDLKIFVADKENGFHTKAYIFENKDDYKIIIGSSNITQRALKSNMEWNVQAVSKKEDSFTKDVIEEYIKLWNSEHSNEVDRNFLDSYGDFIKKLKSEEKSKKIEFDDYKLITPNSMQKRAIENLNRLRESGETKALVIAATGTGKTYMSAFDVINYKPNKLLFLVHREEILNTAEKTFKKLVKNKKVTTGLITGSKKNFKADYIFSTIQSMNNCLDEFKRDHFDYIVVDEAHHSSSDTYKKVMDYFRPKFVLGMTATPERCDTENIFDIYDNNVALEVRLREALELELVIPFHYFGITDIEDVDLSDIKADDISEISKRLQVNKRVDFIIEKMDFYGYDGLKLKCLGFCVNIEHAKYMANEFNIRGIKSIYLSSDNKPEERQKVINRLENDEDELEVIFTVDIFNEGVDIPSVNTVLMLRPTNSPIVFIQQLGRGLRKYQDKSFLTVLDFIGNHNKAFLIALALNGSRYYDKDSLKVAVATQFSNIPGCTNIQMDRISQERILEQLNTENFNSMKYLKEEYLEFKKMNSGKVPYLMMDYEKYDGAPNPLKFLNKEKTYLGFVAKIEKDEALDKLLENEVFSKILKELTDKLPVKRIYEFSIIKYLIQHEEIDFNKAKREILKYIDNVDDESIEHALNTLNQNYYDSAQLKNYVRCFDYKDGILSTTWDFKKIIQNKKYKIYIEDVLNYGIVLYEKSFENKYYGNPFLKLYEQYQMVDAALLSNYTKIHSSFRGSGLITNGKEYFLFVDLHKDEDIKESINYKDKFIGQNYFQWQTPNNTAQNSERGKNIIDNRIRGINLHIFVRKYKEIDGVVQQYIYIGKGDTVEYNGERPITVKIKLQNKMPVSLYTEFIKKV